MTVVGSRYHGNRLAAAHLGPVTRCGTFFVFFFFFHGVGGENPRLDPRILSHKQTPVSRCQPLPFSAHARLFGGLPPYPPSHHVCLPPLPCVLASLCASSRASGEGAGGREKEREASLSQGRRSGRRRHQINK